MRNGWVLALIVAFAGQAHAQSAAQRYREALRGGRHITLNEARSICALVRNANDRANLQRVVDELGDGIDPGAAEDRFRTAGLTNLPGSVRAQVRRLANAQHRVEASAMRTALAAIVRSGYTPAERRVLRASLFQLANPHLPRPAKLTDDALLAWRRVEQRADADTPEPFDQRLPSKLNEANRIRQANGSELWPVTKGAPLHDGLGNVRGTLTLSSAKVNFGQRRFIRNQWMVYVFATAIRSASNATQGASGWVPESAFAQPFRQMPTIDAMTPIGGASGPRYRVTGGDNAAFGDAKVNPNVKRDKNEAATDYLLRPGNVVNLLYALPGGGGVSNDTFPRGVTFVRATQVQPQRTRLYYAESTRTYRIPFLTFVYGRIEVPGQPDRYGWIALEALQRM
jgi:hypothetical protein